MTRRKTTCARPDCDRAIPGHPDDMKGLCFRHALAAGIAHHLQPGDEAHHIVADALDRGWRITDITRTIGLSERTIWRIKSGKNKRVRQTTLDLLRTLPHNPQGVLVPAGPTVARIEDLRAAGFTVKELAQECGVGYTAMVNYGLRNTRVPADVEAHIQSLHDKYTGDQVGGPCVWLRCTTPATRRIDGIGSYCPDHYDEARDGLEVGRAA